jgi:hypothetical protein
MFGILKALIRIAQEVRRIREILEIVHSPELERYKQYARYPKNLGKDSDREFIASELEEDEYEEPKTRP